MNSLKLVNFNFNTLLSFNELQLILPFLLIKIVRIKWIFGYKVVQILCFHISFDDE